MSSKFLPAIPLLRICSLGHTSLVPISRQYTCALWVILTIPICSSRSRISSSTFTILERPMSLRLHKRSPGNATLLIQAWLPEFLCPQIVQRDTSNQCRFYHGTPQALSIRSLVCWYEWRGSASVRLAKRAVRRLLFWPIASITRCYRQVSSSNCDHWSNNTPHYIGRASSSQESTIRTLSPWKKHESHLSDSSPALSPSSCGISFSSRISYTGIVLFATSLSSTPSATITHQQGQSCEESDDWPFPSLSQLGTMLICLQRNRQLSSGIFSLAFPTKRQGGHLNNNTSILFQ